ncbi:MAG: hypothetical protein H7201_13655 [Candidatus Saccharibacteria bacterium]|nr:hypothetical protein [Microbacteriaceae bacterium]
MDGRFRATVPVRPDVRFHDDTLLEVSDVVYSLRRSALLHDGMASLWHDVLLGTPAAHPSDEALAEMFAKFGTTDGAVTIVLDRPFGPLEKFLAQWSLILPRKWCSERGGWTGELSDLQRVRGSAQSPLDREANGSGPYLLSTLGPSGDGLTMIRHEGYWREHGDVDIVEFVPESDRVVREQSLMSGSSDFAVCQPESLDRLSNDQAFVLERLPQEWSINPLGFINQTIRPDSDCLGSGEWGPDGHPADAFADQRLRRMLNHAFDAEEFARQALDSQVVEHEIPFPAPAAPGGRLDRAGFDIEAARSCWRSAWDGVPHQRGMHLRIETHKDNASRLIAAQMLADGLAQVDPRIVVTIREMALGELTDRLYAGDLSVAWIGWAGDYADPYAFASTLVYSPASIPQALGIRDAEIDEAVAQARAEQEPAAAVAWYRAIAERTAALDLFLTPPGKVSYMTYSRRWTDLRLKNQIPHSLDYRQIRSA